MYFSFGVGNVRGRGLVRRGRLRRRRDVGICLKIVQCQALERLDHALEVDDDEDADCLAGLFCAPQHF